jgi:hypothetical protein
VLPGQSVIFSSLSVHLSNVLVPVEGEKEGLGQQTVSQTQLERSVLQEELVNGTFTKIVTSIWGLSPESSKVEWVIDVGHSVRP